MNGNWGGIVVCTICGWRSFACQKVMKRLRRARSAVPRNASPLVPEHVTWDVEPTSKRVVSVSHKVGRPLATVDRT